MLLFSHTVTMQCNAFKFYVITFDCCYIGGARHGYRSKAVSKGETAPIRDKRGGVPLMYCWRHTC